MDSIQIRYATALVHVTSAFGFITNIIAIFTIIKSIKLHSSFGIICAALAANNSFVLVSNTLWYSMPEYGAFEVGSMLSRTIGMIGMSLWVVGVRFHMLISANRLFTLAFPVSSQRYITSRSTTVAVLAALFLSLAQCAPLVMFDGLWFCYDHKTMQWTFSKNDIGRYYEANFNVLPITVEFGCVLLLDVITIIYLRSARSEAFSQSVPLLILFLVFAFVTPTLTDHFARFLSTTFMWHLAHGVDGLIIDLFHTRRSVFKKVGDASSAFSVSFVHVTA